MPSGKLKPLAPSNKLKKEVSSELEYQLLPGHELELIDELEFRELIAETGEVKKMLISFFQKLKADR